MAQPRAFAFPTTLDPQVAALKLPPHSIEAEQSLIGGLLLDNSAWDRIADLVTENDFYRDDHRRIFRHVEQADRAGEAGGCRHGVRIDREERRSGAGRRTRLPRRDRQQHAFGRQHPPLCGDRARASGPAKARQRRATEIASTALNPLGKDAKTLLDEAESKIFEIAEAGARSTPGLRRRSSHCSAKWSTAFKNSTTATTRPTSPVVPTGFHRSRRHDLGPAAGRPDHRRRPPVDGQDRVRAQHRRARGGGHAPTGGDLQPGDAGLATGDALIGFAWPARPAAHAHRPPQRRRMGAHDRRAGQAARGADPHRRERRHQRRRPAGARAAAATASTASSA